MQQSGFPLAALRFKKVTDPWPKRKCSWNWKRHQIRVIYSCTLIVSYIWNLPKQPLLSSNCCTHCLWSSPLLYFIVLICMFIFVLLRTLVCTVNEACLSVRTSPAPTPRCKPRVWVCVCVCACTHTCHPRSLVEGNICRVCARAHLALTFECYTLNMKTRQHLFDFQGGKQTTSQLLLFLSRLLSTV